MENETLETLLVAQVLTLAAALQTLSKVKDKGVHPNWELEAAKLINRRRGAVLQLLGETRQC